MKLAITGVVGQALALAALVVIRFGRSQGVQSVKLRSDGRTEPTRRPFYFMPPAWAAPLAFAAFATATIVALVGAARL